MFSCLPAMQGNHTTLCTDALLQGYTMHLPGAWLPATQAM